MNAVKRYGLDIVQLHGNETMRACHELKDLGVKVIKVFSVDDNMDFSVTIPFREAADYFLFDTKGKYFGGNAKRFNWKILSRYDQQVPFFLSGGIAPEHVEDIKKLTDVNLLAIDVNSGVEISPARKDVEKIRVIQKILKAK
jgi:phosphoribosylanthranilate isomerase